MGETLERWAPLARLMRSDDWRDAERCAAGELDYFEPHDDWCVDQDGARLVLAYRDKVAAGLCSTQAACLLWAFCGNAWPPAPWARPLFSAPRELTDFGREVASVLQEGCNLMKGGAA